MGTSWLVQRSNSPKLRVLPFCSSRFVSLHWITDVSCLRLSDLPYCNLRNEEISQPQFLEMILIKVAGRAVTFPVAVRNNSCVI